MIVRGTNYPERTRAQSSKMRSKTIIVIFVWLSVLFDSHQQACGANILCIMTVPSPSHHLWNRVWMETLAQRGHNLTVVTQDKDISKPNLTYILLENVYPSMFESGVVDYVQMSQDSAFKTVFSFLDFFDSICDGALSSQGLNVILNYPDDFHFNLVIYDYGCGPCLLPLLHKFKYPPLISMTPFNNPPYSVDVIGGHKHYAYTPYFALKYDSQMSFIQRTYNTFLSLLSTGYRNLYIMPRLDQKVRRYFNYSNMPYLGDLEQRTQLMLVNTNPALDAVEPLPPNVIAVGGAHIKHPEPLPMDLEEFVEKSKKGAVLFSLGSNIRSDQIGEERQHMFIEAFRQIPQYHFLWKFESKLKLNIPPNVIIRPWMPQHSILAHPKTKAFISHSGGLSTQEASWFGVPLIGMPFFMDQIRNCHRSVTAGVAEALDFQKLSVENIRNTVLKVLETPSYMEKMKRRSKLFQDQPEKPLNRLVWWVEYVLRNPNSNHMRSPTLELGYVRSNLLDVYAFFLLLIVLMHQTTKTMIKSIYKKCNLKKRVKKD